jgi:hypothetical protein
MRVRVHIERLILDGLPLGGLDGPRLQAALSEELTRLIGAQGISAELRNGGAYPSLPTEALFLARDENPRRLGTRVAKAVFSRIGGQRHD